MTIRQLQSSCNCKDELLAEVGSRKLIAAVIYDLRDCFDSSDNKSCKCKLPLGYSDQQLQEFLRSLDFGYDNGFGSQIIEGTLWYADGSWSDRSEYDGSEWWVYRCCPDPSKL